jgi:hypothetical protein
MKPSKHGFPRGSRHGQRGCLFASAVPLVALGAAARAWLWARRRA